MNTTPAATVPEPIREAWQILASAAHILDAPDVSTRDLLDMTVLGDAMDALTLGRAPGDPIEIGNHAHRSPRQAARCALAVLDGYRTSHAPDQVRVACSRRLLRRLVNATTGQQEGAP